MGKSTSAQILARDHGFVYYEADAFGLMKNPFIDVNAPEASLAATTKQRGLKGLINIFPISLVISLFEDPGPRKGSRC